LREVLVLYYLLTRLLVKKKFSEKISGYLKRYKLRHTKSKLREHGDVRTGGRHIVRVAYMRRPNESYVGIDNAGDDDEET